MRFQKETETCINHSMMPRFHYSILGRKMRIGYTKNKPTIFKKMSRWFEFSNPITLYLFNTSAKLTLNHNFKLHKKEHILVSCFDKIHLLKTFTIIYY